MPKKSKVADIIAKMNGVRDITTSIHIAYKDKPGGFQDVAIIFTGTSQDGKRISKRLELNISELADVASELIINNIRASQIQC